MGTKITNHASIEEIVEAFLNSHPELWVKPETGPAVNLVDFIVRHLRTQHRILCMQHIHDMLGSTICKHCGFGGGLFVGAMSGSYDFGVTI